MIAYRAKLTEYSAQRNAICTEFCTMAAKAEVAFETANNSAHSTVARDAAHDALKAQFRTANQTRRTALKALGPPPVVPTQLEF